MPNMNVFSFCLWMAQNNIPTPLISKSTIIHNKDATAIYIMKVVDVAEMNKAW